jgi:hypothetical protein
MKKKRGSRDDERGMKSSSSFIAPRSSFVFHPSALIPVFNETAGIYHLPARRIIPSLAL